MSKSRTRKMTFNMLNEMVEDNAPVEIVVNEEKDLKLVVKRNLSLGEIHGFVSAIVGACFNQDGEYLPEAFDLAVGVSTMVFYAGVSTPDDLGKAYRVLTQTHLIYQVISVIDVDQYNALISAARKGVAYRKQAIIQANVGKINEIAEIMSNVLTESEEATKALSDPEIKQAITSFLSYSGGAASAEAVADEKVDDRPAGDNVILFRPDSE